MAAASKDAKGLGGFEAGEEADRLDWGREAPAAQQFREALLRQQGDELGVETEVIASGGKA